MSVPTGPVAPGTSFTVEATFVDANGNTVNQPITWASSDDTVLTVTGDGASGVSTATCTVDPNAADGATASGTATGTNVDGSTVATGSNNPFTITVQVTAPPPDLGVAVNIV